MDFNLSDIPFLVLVLWIVYEILNNDDWGGGRRVRNNDQILAPASS